jgi:CBS domain-containing protein
VSGLPVVDEDKNLVGIITESDIFRMLVRTRTPQPIA